MMAIQNKRSTTLILLFALVAAFIGKASAVGTLDDWRKCAANCCLDCADCVDGCTDDYNSSSSTEKDELPPSFKLKERTSSSLRAPRDPVFTKLSSIGGFINCPEGTTPSAFPMPIYDAETGLWVIGYETVWFCIDDSLEPPE